MERLELGLYDVDQAISAEVYGFQPHIDKDLNPDLIYNFSLVSNRDQDLSEHLLRDIGLDRYSS